MYSGLQLIGSIDDAFGSAQQRTGALHAQINSLSERLLEVRKEEGDAYRRLALVRLGLAGEDPLIGSLEALDGNVRAAKQRLHAGSAEMDAEISNLQIEIQRLRANRAMAAEAVERRRATYDDAVQDVRQRVEKSEPYRQQQQVAEQAARIAAAAEEKTRQAEADRREKGEPYEADELFQYLWRRGYGTSTYAAGFLARMVDRWIARFIGFDKARASFAMLDEIPRRLLAHAERQRALADGEVGKLEEMQRAALETDELMQCHGELAEAEAKVDGIDDRIDAKAAALIEAQQRRAVVLTGEDPATRAATAVIVEALRRQELRALRDQARRTEAPEDDAAVRALETLEAEEQQILASIEEAKQRQEKQRRELEGIGALRRDYRRRGYNRGSFDSAAGVMLGSMLGQVLGGAIGRDTFWGEVGRHHRPTRAPGGWGGGWGGGGGGGDFRTGGGF